MADGPDQGGFGDRLRRLRLTAGLTQEELAERAALSVRGISDLERGARTAPQRETLRLLTDALGLAGADRGEFLAAARRRPPEIVEGQAGDPGPRWLGRARPPLTRTTFLGREREIAAAADVLRAGDVRVLTLTGPGGVGKTRLALAVAARTAAEFPDGAAFVDLAPLRDPGLLASAVAEALALSETGSAGPDELVRAALSGRRVLLIFDNLEQLDGAGRWIGAFLAACPGPVVLATSRVRLRLAAEWDYPVRPLPLPDAAGPDLGVIADADAVRLFAARAQTVLPSFAVTAENASTVAAICTRLDGLPLAIELAAARARTLPLLLLRERLARALPLLTRGAFDAPERQQTVRDMIAWSVDLLGEPDQRLFARLAVFAGGVTYVAAEVVCNPAGYAPVDVLDGIESLLDASLLVLKETPAGEPRFRMLETVREYAAELLEARPEEADVRHVHATHFLAFAKQAAPDLVGPNADSWLDRLDDDHGNLRAALEWLADHDPAALLRLAAALRHYWEMRGHWTEGRAWLERALSAAGGYNRARAEALLGAGLLAELQGDLDIAEGRYAAAMESFHSIGDQDGVMAATSYRAALAQVEGAYDRARSLHVEVLGYYRAQGEERRAAVTLHALGEIAMWEGRHADAEAALSECTRTLERIGDERGRIAGVQSLAGLAGHLGRDAEALALWDEVIFAHREYCDPVNLANALASSVTALAGQGAFVRAWTALDEAQQLFEQLGDRGGTAFALMQGGGIARAEGRAEDAERMLREALVGLRAVGLPNFEPECLEGLAGLAAGRGDGGRAARLLGAAAALRERIGSPIGDWYRSQHDRDADAARALLGEAGFRAAWEAGRALSDDAVVAEALRR